MLPSGLERQTERRWDVGELEPCDLAAVGELGAAVLLEKMWRCSVPVPEEDEAVTAELLALTPVPSGPGRRGQPADQRG